MNIKNGKVSLQTDKKGEKTVLITVGGEAVRNDGNELSVQQNLTLSADFIFKIKLKEKEVFSEEEFKRLTQEYALNLCIIKIQEIVKNITSIDYGSPIIIHDFDLPSGVTIFREKSE